MIFLRFGGFFDIKHKALQLYRIMHAIIAQVATSVTANQRNSEERDISVSSCFFLVPIFPLP